MGVGQIGWCAGLRGCADKQGSIDGEASGALLWVDEDGRVGKKEATDEWGLHFSEC